MKAFWLCVLLLAVVAFVLNIVMKESALKTNILSFALGSFVATAWIVLKEENLND